MSMDRAAVADPGTVRRAASDARRRGKRIRFAIAGLILVAALGYMIYSGIASNSEYYLTVSEVYTLGAQAQESQIKIGGTVVEGSVVWERATNAVSFDITDEKGKRLPVIYAGVVPDSFQPGAEVILEGKLQQDGRFAATTLLAKCASKYEPQIPGMGG
ncbi:MAG: cytochrome c maturation protein CcmE [Sphingomonadaceae bacterium]